MGVRVSVLAALNSVSGLWDKELANALGLLPARSPCTHLTLRDQKTR